MPCHVNQTNKNNNKLYCRPIHKIQIEWLRTQKHVQYLLIRYLLRVPILI